MKSWCCQALSATVSTVWTIRMEIAQVDKKYDYHLCGERLTTGPDLPVRPIGPGGPLIASCRQMQQTLYKLHSKIQCLSFLHNILYVELDVYVLHTCFFFIILHHLQFVLYSSFMLYINNSNNFLYITYFISCLQVHALCWIKSIFCFCVCCVSTFKSKKCVTTHAAIVFYSIEISIRPSFQWLHLYVERFWILSGYICVDYNHSQKRKQENPFHHLSSSGTWCFGLYFLACSLTALLLYCDIIACVPQPCNKCWISHRSPTGFLKFKCSAPFPPVVTAHTLCVLSIFNSLSCLSICSRWSFYVDTLQPARQVSF